MFWEIPFNIPQSLSSIFNQKTLTVNTLTFKEITNLISTSINAGIQDKEVLEQLLELTKQNIEQFAHEDVVTIVGALIIEHCETYVPLITILLERINAFQSRKDNQTGEIWISGNLFMINKVVKLYNLLSEKKYKLNMFYLENSLLTQIKKDENERKARRPKSSKMHTNISRFLRDELRITTFKEEEWLEGFWVDIFFPKKRLVIEIDGPTHFERNTTIYNRKEVIKEKYLELKGFTLIRVPYSEKDKRKYLKDELIRIYGYDYFLKLKYPAQNTI